MAGMKNADRTIPRIFVLFLCLSAVLLQQCIGVFEKYYGCHFSISKILCIAIAQHRVRRRGGKEEE